MKTILKITGYTPLEPANIIPRTNMINKDQEDNLTTQEILQKFKAAKENLKNTRKVLRVLEVEVNKERVENIEVFQEHREQKVSVRYWKQQSKILEDIINNRRKETIASWKVNHK